MIAHNPICVECVELPPIPHATAGGEIGFLGAWIRGIPADPNVMERTMTRKAFGLAGVAAALLAAPAFAHHSFAMFDQSKVIYVSGTVKELEFVNPHAWLQIVVNDKGDASTWSFEGGSVPQLVRLGWSKDAFKVGDDIEVGFRPMKDGSRGGQLMSVKFSNGQRVCSNRGCGDGTGTILNGTPAE
jgi:hypothetical protein